MFHENIEKTKNNALSTQYVTHKILYIVDQCSEFCYICLKLRLKLSSDQFLLEAWIIWSAVLYISCTDYGCYTEVLSYRHRKLAPVITLITQTSNGERENQILSGNSSQMNVLKLLCRSQSSKLVFLYYVLTEVNKYQRTCDYDIYFYHPSWPQTPLSSRSMSEAFQYVSSASISIYFIHFHR